MIRFENVSYSIEGTPIIRNVSFAIEQGESRVIMGHSGSGKSTLLRLILGLASPDSGDIYVSGHNICRVGDREKNEIRKQIGMVFQDGALFDSLTVGENVGYYLLEYTRMPIAEIEEKVREMLGFVGLDPDIIDRLPDELSGGMQRRVAIGRALLSTDPKIMLYDEPTTGLDPQMTVYVLDLINQLAEIKKVSSIVVTHQIADAFELTEKFIIIDNGSVVFDGDISEMRQSREAKVISFLKPFRDSIANVSKKEFV